MLPQKHNLSRLEPDWRQSRLNPWKFLARTRRFLHPPVETTVRQSRNGSYYRAQKKNRDYQQNHQVHLQQESPPAREAGVASRNTIVFGGRDRSPQYSLFFSTRVAPRKKDSCRQGSPLVIQLAGCLLSIAAAAFCGTLWFATLLLILFFLPRWFGL